MGNLGNNNPGPQTMHHIVKECPNEVCCKIIDIHKVFEKSSGLRSDDILL